MLRHASPALVALAATTAACGARTSPLTDPPRADAARDAPAVACATIRAQRCATWTLGAAQPLTSPLASRFVLRELRGDCAGAWLMADATSAAGQAVTVIARIPAGAMTAPRVRVDVAVQREATLAVDFVSGRAAQISDGGSGYVFARLDVPTFPDVRPVPVAPAMGFSLSGARDGAATPTGFTFLAEQVRALWGVEQLTLDAAGAFVGRAQVPIPMDLGLMGPEPRYERAVYDDGAQTLLWTNPRTRARHAVFLDATLRADAEQQLRVMAPGTANAGAVASDDGFVDATISPTLGQFEFFTRDGRTRRNVVGGAVGTDLSPQGLAIAFTRGTLLRVSQVGSGVPQLGLAAYTGDALVRPAPLRLAAPVTAARVAPVGDGAMAVFTDATGATFAAPIECR